MDKLNVNEKELSAFVQQQVLDLAPHLEPQSPVAFKLDKTKRLRGGNHRRPCYWTNSNRRQKQRSIFSD